MIVFIHIPKTAGTTFYDIVKRNHNLFLRPKEYGDTTLLLNEYDSKSNVAMRLPGGYNSASNVLSAVLELPDNEKKRISFVGGHVGYGVHDYTSIPVDYISFIREPHSRLISDFREHHKKGRYFYESLKQSNFSFNHYLNLLLDERLDNLMTRQILGPYDVLNKERSVLSFYDLNQAIENSKSIKFFDISNFNSALLYFFQVHNWKKLNFDIKNKSKSTFDNMEYDENLLEQVLKFDKKLYEFIIVENVAFNSTLERIRFILSKIQK